MEVFNKRWKNVPLTRVLKLKHQTFNERMYQNERTMPLTYEE